MPTPPRAPATAYVVVLRIFTDDPDDDPRRWPFDDMLAAPEGEAARHIAYVYGTQEARP